MNVKRILLGFDGSPSSYKAFNEAVDLAVQLKAMITVITVVQIPEFSPLFDEVDEAFEQVKNKLNPEFKKIEKTAKERGLVASCVLLTGNPAETIIRYANERNFDLIIVGTRGLGRLKQLLIGSVAQKVVTCANIPVMTIPDKN